PAAAEVAAHCLVNVLTTRRWHPLEQGRRADDLAWRAEPALERVLSEERLLHGRRTPRREALDRDDFVPDCGLDEEEARVDRLAVEGGRAGAARPPPPRDTARAQD